MIFAPGSLPRSRDSVGDGQQQARASVRSSAFVAAKMKASLNISKVHIIPDRLPSRV